MKAIYKIFSLVFILAFFSGACDKIEPSLFKFE